MIDNSWIMDSLGQSNVDAAVTEAHRRRLHKILAERDIQELSDDRLQLTAFALELRVRELINTEQSKELTKAAAAAFQISRVIPLPVDSIERAQDLVRLGCLGVLGDRGPDVRRIVRNFGIPKLPIDTKDWGIRVWVTILDVCLRLFQQHGWEDLDLIQARVRYLRESQELLEPEYLSKLEETNEPGPAWWLISIYHLARAAEIFGMYQTQGSINGLYDIREQLETHFDRALAAASHSTDFQRENLIRLLPRTFDTLVNNSIWTVTRAVNTRVTKFVESLVDRQHQQPLCNMLPPQRRTLSEEGLLGSSHRCVVISLPTSSGKTLIAEFRILQALNQFDHERGWVAYLAPTRALVNQLTRRLRRDFANIKCKVEKVSPALEIDALEADILREQERDEQFRILVTTPEKFDLMLRNGWEKEIGRPLTLVVVDEAHGLGAGPRGLRLELLLATIKRECQYAQFILLTPFIPNAEEIARWLAQDRGKAIQFGLEWVPNDRVIAMVRPKQGTKRGDYFLEFETQHTTQNTVEIPETLEIGERRPLGLTLHEVRKSSGKLAAATTHVLQQRGTVIMLEKTPGNCWTSAKTLKVEQNRLSERNENLSHIQAFIEDEMGTEHPLVSLLDHGIGVHHSGLSDDVRSLVEWLTEQNILKVLVATTTIAQGVNFPVSGVVFATHQYPWVKDIPPEDFWNIAGRAGRIDQEDLGIVALVGNNANREQAIGKFVGRVVGELNSTLIDMVQRVMSEVGQFSLERLSWRPEWSSFVQYLAHTYRQIGNHERFVTQVEQILRGTLGFRDLRNSHQGWAENLVKGVHGYAERIKGESLTLVDTTGLSWESVSNTLRRLKVERLSGEIWSPELFSSRRDQLTRVFGVLLQVPELRNQLKEVSVGSKDDGKLLARIVCDWVQGHKLSDIATDYFKPTSKTDVDAMTKCCTKIFGRLTQTASWGIAAMQALTMGDLWDNLSESDQRVLRNLPARIYYGVNSDEAVALRVLGVPRTAAEPLVKELAVDVNQPLYQIRASLREGGEGTWKSALGEKRGTDYHRVWSIIEGET